jgi:hypothetical protein
LLRLSPFTRNVVPQEQPVILHSRAYHNHDGIRDNCNSCGMDDRIGEIYRVINARADPALN